MWTREELSLALKQVQHSRREALIEYERRVAKLQELDKMLAKLSVAHGEQASFDRVSL